MSTVNIFLTIPDPGGVDQPVEGWLEWVPTRRRSVAPSAVVLPESFRVKLGHFDSLLGRWVHDGMATVVVAANTLEWCWKVVEHVPHGITRYVNVIDSAVALDYSDDLVDVDPATFLPTATPEAAWWAMANGTIVSGEVVGDDLILTKYDGSLINAGNVRGPAGDPGSPGDPGAPGDPGDNGREVELQTTATHVQWRYVGDVAWTDLIALSAITGPAGADGAAGVDGDDGLSVELQTTATHIQWRLVGGTWADLVPLSALVGPAGPSGSGATGLLAELTVAGWSANSQTVTATGVTASSLLVVAPTPADQVDYVAAGVICTTQDTDSLTFTCTTTPTTALDVQVVIL